MSEGLRLIDRAIENLRRALRELERFKSRRGRSWGRTK